MEWRKEISLKVETLVYLKGNSSLGRAMESKTGAHSSDAKDVDLVPLTGGLDVWTRGQTARYWASGMGRWLPLLGYRMLKEDRLLGREETERERHVKF